MGQAAQLQPGQAQQPAPFGGTQAQMNPAMLQQIQALMRAQAPGQMAMGMGNAPAGQGAMAGAGNGLSKLALGLMQRNMMNKYNQRYGQTGAQVP